MAVLLMTAAFSIYDYFPTESASGFQLAETETTNDIDVEFSYGFRNIAKSGRMLPVMAEISNNTADEINGRLLMDIPCGIETDQSRYESIQAEYSYSVTIPAHQTVEVMKTISITEGVVPLDLKLVDESGDLLYESTEEITLQNIDSSSLLIGVLSDTPEDLEYLNGVTISDTDLRTRTVELDAGVMPENSSGLEQFDMLIVTHYDISKLNSKQIDAIINWMDNGGAVLLGTGEDSTAVTILGREIEGLSIEGSSLRQVNMGLMYSISNPDEAVLELNVCNVFAPGGSELMESGELSILTVIPQNNGIMGITAYDLCDISLFCEEVPQYTDDLISNVFGSSRLQNLNSSSNEMNDLYDTALNLLDILDPTRLPSVMVYVLFGIIYILLAGIGIYFFLKSHGLSLYLVIAVSIVAFMGIVGIWLLNAAFNNSGIKLNYAFIKESSDLAEKDTGFISLTSSDLSDYEINFPQDSEFHFIAQQQDESLILTENQDTGSNTLGNNAQNQFETADTESAAIVISDEDENVRLSVKNMKPFVPVIEEYSRTNEDVSGSLKAELICFEGDLSGTVTNQTPYDVEDATVIMYGKLVKLGNISSGQSVSLDHVPVINIPIGNVENVAAFMTRLDTLSPNTSEYANALKHMRLLLYYMRDSLNGHFDGARLLAFSDDTGIISGEISSQNSVDITGNILIVNSADISYEENGYTWTDCMETEPAVVSGNYNAVDNTTSGSCVLEYNLGSNLRVTRFGFTSVSDYFLADENSEPFSGNILLYNYVTSVYESFDYLNDTLDETEILPYLSPGNTVTCRFNSFEDTLRIVRMYLPLPDVTGVSDR